MKMRSLELERLVGIDQLDRLAPTADEVKNLIASGSIRLRDSQRVELSEESRFDLAYNGAHSLALAALRHAGYRSKNRFVVFQALEHTLSLPAEKWRVLAKAHSLCNQMEYEGDNEIDRQLLEDMIKVAAEVESLVTELVK